MAKKIHKTEVQTVTYEYKTASNYTIYPIVGGVGGFNSSGDIILNLFTERPPIPEKHIYKVLDDGKVEPPKTSKSSEFIREILFGISLKPNNARDIAAWLIKTADDLEKRLKDDLEKN